MRGGDGWMTGEGQMDGCRDDDGRMDAGSSLSCQYKKSLSCWVVPCWQGFWGCGPTIVVPVVVLHHQIIL